MWKKIQTPKYSIFLCDRCCQTKRSRNSILPDGDYAGGFFTKPLQENLFRKFRAVILRHVPVSSLYHIEDNASKERVEAHMKDEQSSDY